MCLAAPGKIIDIHGDDPLQRMGKVSFSGIVKEINLSYVPDAKVDDYVIVHVGFALNTIDQDEADKLLEDIKAIEDMGKEEWEGEQL